MPEDYSWEDFYKDLRAYWANQERDALIEAKDQYKTFAKLLRLSVAKRNLGNERLCKDILNNLKREMEVINVRIRDLTGVASRNIRFTHNGFGKDGRRSGDKPKNVANVIPQNIRIDTRPHVRYRWKNQPRKNHPGPSTCDGCGETGI